MSMMSQKKMFRVGNYLARIFWTLSVFRWIEMVLRYPTST